MLRINWGSSLLIACICVLAFGSGSKAQEQAGGTAVREVTPSETLVETQALIGPQVALDESFRLGVMGDYVAAGVGMRNLGEGTINISLPASSTIVRSFLYWAIVREPGRLAGNRGRFNSKRIRGTLVGTSGDPCWPSFGAGNFIDVYRADVTKIAVNGPNFLSDFPSGLTDNTAPQNAPSAFPLLEGASLVVIFENPGFDFNTVIIRDGAQTINRESIATSFGNFTPLSGTTATDELAQTTYIVADGQARFQANQASFDSTVVAGPTSGFKSTDAFDGADGIANVSPLDGLWDTLTVDISTFFTVGVESSADARVVAGTGGDCLTWVAQVFSVKVNPLINIFAGILGGRLKDAKDDPDRDIDVFLENEKIVKYVQGIIDECSQLNKNPCDPCAQITCDPTNVSDLQTIANQNDAGGIVALAFFITSTPSDSAVYLPGNSDISKTKIDATYSIGDKVYAVGHSVGGGDVQNLLEKLDTLGIPVELSGHIDSIELEPDEDRSIPANTLTAKGYYQKETVVPTLKGEDSLFAVDPGSTTVTNDEIVDVVGPQRFAGAAHRNMDNDIRVWGDILLEILTSTIEAQSGPTITDVNIQLMENDAEQLISLLDSPMINTEKRQVRNLLAKYQPAEYIFDYITMEYYTTDNDELKIHYQSIISKIDPIEFVEKVFIEAKETDDETLFVSLAYSLGNANTEEAKFALLRLIEQNNLVRKTQGLTAIFMNLSRGLTPYDGPWLREVIEQNSLTAKQLSILVRAARKHLESEEFGDFGEELMRRAKDASEFPGVWEHQ